MKQTEYPLTTVGALIVNREGRFLLIKTHKWSDKYGIPGGKIELGETCEEALIREIKEETDLGIYDIHFAAVIESIFEEEFYKPKHMILLNYFCKTQDEAVKLNYEAQSYCWTNLEESKSLPLNLATKKLLALYEQSQ